VDETDDMTEPADPKVEWLTVAGDPDIWRSIGLTVTDDGLIPLVGASIRIVEPVGSMGADGDRGIVGWALSGTIPASSVSSVPEGGTHATEIDGLPTQFVDPATPAYAAHPIAASGLDHVVVLTSDLERTSEAITAATGCELKRIREVGTMRQGFHRVGRGGLIVELVERPDLPDGPASFWGLVLIVDDLDAACELIGADRISPPKDAVQPGRRIATVRGDVGLGLPVALMSH
jgi:hypothetical protein